MPFTVSHAAAALPFFRFSRLVSRSGLVIGTMVPDLPIFLDFGRYDLSHSAAGIFLFNLPVGFVLWLIWQHWMRDATEDLCPGPLRQAVFHAPRHASRRPVSVYLSLCLGAATHVCWDGFTHYTGFGTALFPVLYTRVFGFPVFSWLQLLSSAFGGGMLVWWLGNRWHSGWKLRPAMLSLLRWLTLLCLSIGVAAAINKNHGVLYIYGTIVASVQVFFSLWLAICVGWNLRRFRDHPTDYEFYAIPDRSGGPG
jgi:hypothetical protein